LAVVLGHEVSHLIYGHISHSNSLELMLRMLEILFLTMDPTEGFLSMGFIYLLAQVHHLLLAAYSREN